MPLVTTYCSYYCNTPIDSPVTTGNYTVYNQDGVAEEGAIIYMQIKEIPPNNIGFAYDSATRSEVSDVNGLVTFDNLFKGAQYRMWRGNTSINRRRVIAIPSTAGDTIELPSIIGQE
jgi:hypothetical protein